VTSRALGIAACALVGAVLLGAPAVRAGDGSAQGAKVAHTPWLGLRFVQDGKEAELVNSDLNTTEVRLKRKPFAILLPTHGADDAYQVAAWSDDSIFAEASAGVRETRFDPPNLPAFFEPGTGMADTAAGSGTLMLDNQAHNYLEGLRLGPDPKRHEYFVSQISGREGSGEMVAIPLKAQKKPIYLVVFLDENGDGSMQNDEYEFIVLHF